MSLMSPTQLYAHAILHYLGEAKNHTKGPRQIRVPILRVMESVEGTHVMVARMSPDIII